jgi:hypothetical protein
MDSRWAKWRKSSRSGSGNCVEVGSAPDEVGVRDTKNPQGRTLAVTREAWSRFIGAVKDDKYRA